MKPKRVKYKSLAAQHGVMIIIHKTGEAETTTSHNEPRTEISTSAIKKL